jgi:hypothetical protein
MAAEPPKESLASAQPKPEAGSAPSSVSSPTGAQAPKGADAPKDAPKDTAPKKPDAGKPADGGKGGGNDPKSKEPKPKKGPPVRPTPSSESYAKRKKRRKIALICCAIGTMGCVALGIIAFLGDYSGTFTVRLDPQGKLTLSLDNDFANKTSYLKASGLENAYAWMADLVPSEGEVDNDTGGQKNGFKADKQGNYAYDTYLGYTFFVRNVSDDGVSYSLDFDITDYRNPTNIAVSLMDILRVRVYENLIADDGTSAHLCTTYARATNTPFEKDDGTVETREPVSAFNTVQGANGPVRVPDAEAKYPENRGFADQFDSNNTVFVSDHNGLAPGGTVRYTVLMWLEGNDPDCKGAEPQNASVTFAMNFSATDRTASEASETSSFVTDTSEVSQ